MEVSEIWVRQIVHPGGRECGTRFDVKLRFERDGRKFSLVRCFPKTGRMHQIRVHLAHSGFPIVGDKIYNDGGAGYLEWMENGWTAELQKRLILPRHALHAARLEIDWTGKPVAWEAALPADLERFLAGGDALAMPDIVIWSRGD